MVSSPADVVRDEARLPRSGRGSCVWLCCGLLRLPVGARLVEGADDAYDADEEEADEPTRSSYCWC